MGFWSGLKERARAIKRDIHALILACRHPAMPWYAKLWILLVVAYALSPIDLIPDFIPVFGYLDDVLLLPLGVLIAIKLIPPGVMAESRARVAAAEVEPRGRSAWIMAAVIALVWLALAAGCGWLVWRAWPNN